MNPQQIGTQTNFPAAASNSGQRVYIRTTDIENQTVLVQSRSLRNRASAHQNFYRQKGNLFWVENQGGTLLKDKINFINSFLNELTRRGFDKDKPLTLISIGAGGSLNEAIVDDQLQDMGFGEVRWRLVEPAFNPDLAINSDQYGEVLAARMQFRDNNRIERTKFYTSVQSYLNKIEENGHRISLDDKLDSNMVVLNIDPPTPPIGNDSRGLLKGVWIRKEKDIDKANAIIALLLPPSLGNREINQTVNTFEGGLKNHKIIAQSFAVKGYLNPFGEPVIEQCHGELQVPDLFVDMIQDNVSQAYHQYRNATNSSSGQTLHTSMAALKLSMEQATQNLTQKRLYIFSDFDLSVDQASGFIADSANQHMTASLVRDAIKFD